VLLLDAVAEAGHQRAIMTRRTSGLTLAAALLLPAILGCTPTVKVEAPSEPITINLNIKLDADVRLRVEEKAKQDVAGKPIF
jgi:YnbE-like lipoprotein